MDHGSGDHRDFLGEPLPAPAFERSVYLVDGFVELLFSGKEVGRNPDTSARAIVDQDVPREKVLGDLVTVRNIDRDGSTPLRRVTRSVDRVAARVGKLDQSRGEAKTLLADGRYAGAARDLRSLRRRIESGNDGSAVQPAKGARGVLHRPLEREGPRVSLPAG